VKNKITSLLLAGAAVITTNYAIADSTDNEDIYAGFQYGFGDFSVSGISQDFDPQVIVGRFGLRKNNFALEGRIGSGIQSDTQYIQGTGDVNLYIDKFYGAYGVGYINLNESASLYGLAGFTYLEASLRNNVGLSESDRDNGLSIGVGADYGVGENITLNLEYTSYIIDSDFDLKVLGLGVTFGY
jgi:opacity protein-like surface antigen